MARLSYTLRRSPLISKVVICMSEKSFVATLILAILLGGFGVHRLYVGKIGTGIVMILTLGGLGIWTLIDVIMIAVGNFKDSNGLPIKP